MEDSEFVKSFMYCFDQRRLLRFKFLVQLARYLIITDEHLTPEVKDRVSVALGSQSPSFDMTVGDRIRQNVRRFWTEGEPECRDDICRTVQALQSDNIFPLLEIERCVSYHGKHLEGRNLESSLKFLACFGFICVFAATWLKDEHIMKIIKETEEVMNSYDSPWPDCPNTSHDAVTTDTEGGKK